MTHSYKIYLEKDFMKKFVNATEGYIIYDISKTHLMVLAKDVGALYKVWNLALINTEVFEKYLEHFKEYLVPLLKYVYGNLGSN